MGSDLVIRVLEPAEFGLWDAFVRHSPQGTVFHTTPWLQATGANWRIYGCFRESRLRGGFVTGQPAPDVAAPPPLTPYLGSVYPPAEGKYVTALTVDKEIGQVCAARLKTDFGFIACRFSPEANDLQPFMAEGYVSSVRYTYRLPLGDLAAAWTNMEQTRRNDIRRAEKDGVTVEQGLFFPRVMAQSEQSFLRQSQGVSFGAVAARLNQRMEEAGTCRGFIARNKEGRDIGAVYIVWDWRRAYYLLGGYQHEASHHGACALAMWEAIRYTRETLGLLEFDFEGSMIPNIERYFRKFGGLLTPTYVVTWEHPSRRRLVSRLKRKITSLIRR